jgi:D-alanyl-D-alanine endopeptidase (penicillin-binding protein 7)
MNSKAQQLGLLNTRFQDPNGLGVGNISTAEEVGHLVINAINYEFIREYGNKTEATLYYEKGQRTRTVGVSNTSQSILRQHRDISVSKTGYTAMAGWCVAFVTNQQHIVVVLGELSKVKRMQQVNRLMHTIYK